MSQNKFEIEFSIKPTKFEIEIKDVVKEIHPDYKQLDIVPNTETQEYNGTFNKVTVSGDENLVPENIKEGVNIFGIDGNIKILNTKITDCVYLFYYGHRLDILNELLSLCENVTDTSYMFSTCMKITDLDLSNFNTSKVTNMKYMFQSCTNLKNLNLSNFDTSNVTSFQNMFYGCQNIQTLDLSHFNTSKVTNFYNMFQNNKSLQSIDVSNFDTKNGTDFYGMFSYCSSLQTLDLSSFDFSSANKINNILYSCTALTNLRSPKNIGKGFTEAKTNNTDYKLDLSKNTNLTHDSLMDVINNLYDLKLVYTGTLYRQSLVLGTTNKAKLTSDEIAIATNKGWNVS